MVDSGAPKTSLTAAADLFFIRSDYRARTTPTYFSDDAEQRVGIVWQPDVYATAGRLARQFGAQRLVDVGCGDGAKLVELRSSFDLYGIDFGANIAACRDRYQFGT